MKPGPLIFIYLIPAYIFLQLCWWAYLLIGLYQDFFGLQGQTGLMPPGQAESLSRGKTWMILGEGLVFILFLIIALRYVHRRILREIEDANRQKNFMLAIAHEFKSPLAAQKLQMETLLKYDLEKDKERKLILNTLEDTERLQVLTENILTAYKLEGGKYPFHPEKFNLRKLGTEVLARLPVAEKLKSLVEIKLPDQEVSTDREAFISILRNLIENALKYGEGSPVRVEGQVSPDRVIFTVADQGPGIQVKYREKIFERFFRPGGEENRKASGTGLGLYLVKNLANLQNGSVSVKENHPKGLIFEVQIPMND